MSKKKRVNPHRQPASQADVERARKEAESDAASKIWAIFFTVLRDKEGYGRKRLRRVWSHVEYLVESLEQGYVTVEDLMQTIEDEAGIVLRIT